VLFLIPIALLSPLIVWSLWIAYTPPKTTKTPTTGPEFATAHGNDSSTWTSADFEAEFVFAEIDVQPAWTIAHPKKTPQATDIKPAA